MIYKREYFKSTDHFTCDITPKRKVKYYELEIYDYGTGYASIDNVLYPHSNDMFILAKPGQERFTVGSFNCYAIHFTCGDEEICKILNDFPSCMVIDKNIKKELISQFELTSSENNLQTVTAICNILNTVNSSNHITSSETKPMAKKIIKVKEYIDNNYQNQIELSKLCEIADWSINYIRKQFYKCYGISIQKYINELRLSYVKKLLISTDMSMCDIAYEAGFNSQAYMNYMFKERFGVSPLKYKTTYSI